MVESLRSLLIHTVPMGSAVGAPLQWHPFPRPPLRGQRMSAACLRRDWVGRRTCSLAASWGGNATHGALEALLGAKARCGR